MAASITGACTPLTTPMLSEPLQHRRKRPQRLYIAACDVDVTLRWLYDPYTGKSRCVSNYLFRPAIEAQITLRFHRGVFGRKWRAEPDATCTQSAASSLQVSSRAVLQSQTPHTIAVSHHRAT